MSIFCVASQQFLYYIRILTIEGYNKILYLVFIKLDRNVKLKRQIKMKKHSVMTQALIHIIHLTIFAFGDKKQVYNRHIQFFLKAQLRINMAYFMLIIENGAILDFFLAFSYLVLTITCEILLNGSIFSYLNETYTKIYRGANIGQSNYQFKISPLGCFEVT